MRWLNDAKQIKLNLSYAVQWRKPALMLKLIRNAIMTLAGAKPLRGMDIVVDFTCNLKCGHCNITTMMQRGRTALSLQEWGEVARQANDMGVVSFTFTGGEPLLRKDFKQLLDVFRPWEHLIIVQTSGFLLDEAKCRWLKEVGVDICNVSLDSFDEKEHDASRGVPGTYRRTMKAIEYCKRIGLKVMAGTVVSHQNLRSANFQELLKFAEKEGILLLANLAIPAGRWSLNQDILLDKEDQAYFRQLLKTHTVLRSDLNSNLLRFGCPAVKEKVYVTPYGDVMGCTFVQISFGNVREMPLKAIREKGMKFPPFAGYNDHCPAAEDPQFIDRYMARIGEAKTVPVPISKFEGQQNHHDGNP